MTPTRAPVTYLEIRNFRGVWTPQVWADAPKVIQVNGLDRLSQSGGQGPAVRHVQPLPAQLHDYPLHLLPPLIGADGKLPQAAP